MTREEMAVATTTGYRRRRRAARKAGARLGRRRARRAAEEGLGAGLAERLPGWTPGQWIGLAGLGVLAAEMAAVFWAFGAPW